MKDYVLVAKAGTGTLSSGKEQVGSKCSGLKSSLSSAGSGFLPGFLLSDAINSGPPGFGDSVPFHV